MANKLRDTRAMDLSAAVSFARTRQWSVLTTIRRNGRPQLSNVGHTVDEAGLIRISVTADRAKYHNLTREPWAALHVTREDFFAYVVLEGGVDLSPVAEKQSDSTVTELVEYYRELAGEHEDWDAYREAMVSERRAVVRFTPDYAYGMLQLPPTSGT